MPDLETVQAVPNREEEGFSKNMEKTVDEADDIDDDEIIPNQPISYRSNNSSCDAAPRSSRSATSTTSEANSEDEDYDRPSRRAQRRPPRPTHSGVRGDFQRFGEEGPQSGGEQLEE